MGNSLAPITETMSLIGADTLTLPFSANVLYGDEFPYQCRKIDYCVFKYIDYQQKDWERYFNYHGLEKDYSLKTGKTLLFTDYIASGRTKEIFTNILLNLGFDMKKTKFLPYGRLLPNDRVIRRDMDLDFALDMAELKKYATKISLKEASSKTDAYKHPEYIMNSGETLKSKLLKFAIFELLHK